MSQTKEISARVGATLNLGNYSSFKFEVEQAELLVEGDKPEDVFKKITEALEPKFQHYYNEYLTLAKEVSELNKNRSEK